MASVKLFYLDWYKTNVGVPKPCQWQDLVIPTNIASEPNSLKPATIFAASTSPYKSHWYLSYKVPFNGC